MLLVRGSYQDLLDLHVRPLRRGTGCVAVYGSESIQFQNLYSAESAAQKERITATYAAIEDLWENFDEESGDFWYGDGDVGRLLMKAWNLTSHAKSIGQRELFRIITRIWTEGGTEGHSEAAKKWCRSHGFDFKEMV